MPKVFRTTRPRPLFERLFEKVEFTGFCWLWTGGLAKGYGSIATTDRKTLRPAHRVAYELLVGPIPEGLDLDHLCRVRACVNPDHLEPVTRKVNLLRSPITVIGRQARHA